jgi:hypothetical protein
MGLLIVGPSIQYLGKKIDPLFNGVFKGKKKSNNKLNDSLTDWLIQY